MLKQSLIPERNTDLFQLNSIVSEKIYALEDYRLGQFLTIIEASITDPEQRKAVKDVARQAHRSQEYFTNEITSALYQYTMKHCPKVAEGFSEALELHKYPCNNYFSTEKNENN